MPNGLKNILNQITFFNGTYKNKVIIVHSKQGRAESEANTKMLLEVEKADNQVEIVIHVNKLKEGWDVNNLYTIIPLRTAASKILREQMVDRGLRLPYGERTGDDDVDAVMLTAHDKFRDILEEYNKISNYRRMIAMISEKFPEMNRAYLPFMTGDLMKEAYEKKNSEVKENV